MKSFSYNAISKAAAEKIAAILNGQTYMNIHAAAYPLCGHFEVLIETDYKTSLAKFKDFAMAYLIDYFTLNA